MNSHPPEELANVRCWKTIGVEGDRSCPRLAEFVHCRNCEVYGEAGQRLFDREAPDEYVAQWTRQLSEKGESQAEETMALLVFRIADEWLALPATAIVEVVQPLVIRRIPHRTSRLMLGMCNVRGELQLCLSLSELLGIAGSADRSSDENRERSRRRFLVVREGDCSWVFPVEEVAGIHRVSHAQLADVPSTVARRPGAFSSGILAWEGKKVAFLAQDRLFQSLQRHVS